MVLDNAEAPTVELPIKIPLEDSPKMGEDGLGRRQLNRPSIKGRGRASGVDPMNSIAHATLATAMLVMVCGCSAFREQVAQQDDALCQSYGAMPGTPQYTD